MKILYVEDDPNDADLARRWLRKHAPQFALEVVATQSEAVARLSGPDAPSFDLVLTDLRLPDGDGLSLLTYIRERGLPFAVVVITGTGDEKTAVTAIKAGADDYVPKRDDYLERLPLTLENALHSYRAQTSRQSRPIKALYAEDYDTDIDLTLRHLQRYAPHIQLDVAPTGAEALQRLLQAGESSRYDVILLDYQLPGLNALEVLKELRQGRGLDIPVVLVTGQGDEEVALQALKLGAASYLVKNHGYLHQLAGELENACYRADIIREQAALKQSEERLRLAQSAARMGIWDWNIVTGESNWSEGIYELRGLAQGDGRASVGGFVGSIHPEDREPAIDKAQSVIRNGEEYNDEFRVIRGDGSIAWLAAKGRVIRGASGSAERMIGVNIDITDRKRAEQALRESEERFRSAFDHATIGMALIALDGGFLQVNRSVCELLGYSEQELIGAKFQSHTHPDDLDSNLACMRQLLAGATQSFQMEKRYFHRQGHTVWVMVSVSLLRDGDGQPLYFISQIQDITERKQWEDALRESEARFRNLADNAPVMVWMSEADGACSYVSQSWVEFTGLTPATSFGCGWCDAIHPDDRELSEYTFLAATKKRETFRLEYRLRRKDGEYRWASDSARPRFGSQGEFLGYIGSVVDFTETKRAELNTQFINQLDFALSQIADADEIIWLATSRLGEYLGVASCYVIEVNPGVDLAVIRESWNGWRLDGKSIVGEYRISDFTTPEFREMLEAGQAAIVNDVTTDPRTRDFASEYEAFGVGAYISIPALNEGQWEATLNVNHPRARDWRPDETQLMRDIAARLWPAFNRARAVEALRESEERYRSVVESQSELICRFLPDTTLTFVNHAYCRYFGRTQEELIGVKFLELIPEPARAVTRKHIESLVENPRVEINEHEVMLPDGGIGWQQWVDHAIPDASGKVVEFQAVGRDITERKKTEEERREREECLRLALEAGRMGVWEWDPRTNAVKWAKENFMIFGLAPFSIEPDYHAWADRVHPDDLQAAMGELKRAIAGKGEFRYEYRVIWPDGTMRWVEDRGKAVYDECGQCLKVSGLIVDITERKRAEDDLRQSEARYRAIVEDQTELVCRILPDGRSTFVNDAYCRYFGCNFEDLIGRTFPPFIPPEEEMRINQFQASITPSNPVGTIEHRVVMPDGEERWHQWTNRGIFDEKGRLLEFQCVGRDVTQRKQAEDRLMESEAQLRLLTELIPQQVWTAFPGNEPDYFNQRWLDYTGMTMDEVRQKGWMTALHPDDHGRVLDAIREASSQKRIYEEEIRLRRFDGQYRWFLAQAITQHDQERNIIKWYGTNTDIEDRKQAEEALRLSEDKFSTAFRSSPDAFAISRLADGIILEVNERWAEIIGYTRDEAVGHTAWELQIYLNPGDRERLISMVNDRGSARDFETDIRKKSGEIRNVLISAEPIMIRDEPCLTLIVRDITQRKHMEWALVQSRRRYSLASTAGRVGVWDWNLQTNEIYVDPELKSMLGYRDDEIQNHLDDWGSHVHPDDGKAVMCAAQDHIEGRTPVYEVEHRMIRKDGAVCWLLARGTLIESENGVRHIVGTDTDITERKRAGEALRESEERLRLALEAGRMGVWEWDTRTNAAKWSKEHYLVMGLEPFSVEPDYYAWADRVHPDDLSLAEKLMNTAIAEKGEYRQEYRVIWPDGSLRWVEDRAKPVYDEDGQCLKVSGLVIDITERKQAEEALRESEEALRKSYARIADLAGRLIAAQEEERKHIARELHDDMNQQVAALAIGISRLKRQLPDAGDDVQEQIAKLREKTDWLSERIRQVSHELHSSILRHVGLPAALNSYCQEFSDREGIVVNLDIQDDVKDVSPDVALCLYRVAQESLRNIARHSGARSAVVELAGVNGSIELRVADQGVGFDPGRALEGRGLGLVSMEERVKSLNGNLVLTTRPGAGTELRAQIPFGGGHEQNKGLAG
ncbi:MAG TPA: PAS domain S-box protein [Blastocatellia bacterium]|nr:PAS domain S-box protein [Blastocatellia bacterium]